MELPFTYDSLQSESGRRPVGFRFSKHIINITARLVGQEIVVCGEADSREIAEAKAFSELVERSALISSAETYNAETSNGWAAHPDKDHARLNAILELVERDAVLSQWYSSTPFFEIQVSDLPEKIRQWSKEELSRSEFPHLRVLLSTRGLGPSVTCLFMDKNGLGVSAHSTRLSLEDSIESAIAEVCRAAHGTIRREHWQDTIKLRDGMPGFVDPGTHAVYYAYHEAFPGWMFGNQLSWDEAIQQWQTQIDSVTNGLNDFIYQPVFKLPLHVGFAKHSTAFNLHWRRTVVEQVAKTKGASRLNLKTETINGKPHIVS